MRRDETVAQILLIISIVNVAFAAPAALRQGHLGVAEGVTAALVKRGESNLISSAPSAGEALRFPQSGPEAQEDKHLTSSAPAPLAGEPLPSQLPHSNPMGSTQEISGAKLGLISPAPLTPSTIRLLRWQHSRSRSMSDSDDSMEWAKPSDRVNELENSPNWDPELEASLRMPESDRYSSERPQSPSPPKLVAPEANDFFNDETKKNIKVVSAMGAIIGISAGVIYGVKKVNEILSSRGYAFSLFPLPPADI